VILYVDDVVDVRFY